MAVGPADRKTEEIDRSNLWRSISCAVARQQVGAGSACRQQVAVGPADRKTEEIDRSNLWLSISCAVARQQVGAGSACQTPQSPYGDSSPFMGAFYASEPCLPFQVRLNSRGGKGNIFPCPVPTLEFGE